MLKIENAKIRSTSIGPMDRGIFTFYIQVEGDGWGCGFGGFALDSFDKSKDRRVGSTFGCEAIMRVLSVLEIDTWEKLPGTPVRAETEGLGGGIRRLGHFLKDQWVDLKAMASDVNPPTA